MPDQPHSRISVSHPTRTTTQSGKASVLDFLKTVAQRVPAEVIAAYQCLSGLIASIDPNKEAKYPYYWGCLAFCAALTAWLVAKGMDGFTKRWQIGIYVPSFLVWAYATNGDKWLPDGKWSSDPVRGIVLVIAAIILAQIPSKYDPLPKKP
jgi:hypothetical protein